MSDPENKVQEPTQESKKTRKTKATATPLGNRSTRRAKRKDSSDECILPQVIPRNQFPQMVSKQSFESEITRVVLQIPLGMFVGDQFEQIETTRVENMPLQIRISRDKDNLSCCIKVPQDVIVDQGHQCPITLHGKYSCLSGSSISNKPIKSIRKMVGKEVWEEVSRLKLQLVHSDFFITLTLRGQEQICEQYLGLVNQGNTCYMNSYLQMLFHLPQFRRLIFAAEIKEKDRFPATLQELFFRMLEEEKAVSPENLITSFGWSKKEAQVQQDVQEFSCLFFDILERKVSVLNPLGHFASVGNLFCGELTHYIQCCNVEDFRTVNHERFYDLHIPLAPNIHQALDDYISEQVLEGDNIYRTDYYGLQEARKGLRISKLPPLLMLQLKRFQYNYQTDSNEKILDECRYPQQMEFSRWTLDPNTEMHYQLYAVLVHEGTFASSGHYYVFIKIENQWVKFNDERVEKTTRERALHYNYGGQTQTVEYNSKEMKVIIRPLQNKATAYMLVYVNKDFYPVLFEEKESSFPQWLIENTKLKLQSEAERKIRKQSICDIPIMRWNKHFKGQTISGMNFIPREIIQGSQQKIQLIPKTQKVEEWLLQLSKQEEDKQVYILWTAQEKQVLINASCRGTQSIKQLFFQIQDPYIFLAPLSITKGEYLVVIKLFNQHSDNQFYYFGLTSIQKDAELKDLHIALSSMFPEEAQNHYYLEDKKLGLIAINKEDGNLLPTPVPTKNQLLVVVVEQIDQIEQNGKVLSWYKQQMDNLLVGFRNETARQYLWERELNKFVTVEEIREIIFQEIITEKEEYQSPRNIVVKYKSKKSSRLLTEAKDTDRLKDITKNEKVIYFCFSSLNINERLTQKELVFYYRDPISKKLSQPQTIIVEKNYQSSIIEMICSNQSVQIYLPPKENHLYRLCILARDRSYINDIVDEKGYVPGKGELLTVLQRQKYSALVLEQYQTPDTDSQLINLLIHHVTKTGEKIGMPRWDYTPSGALLSALKYYIMELIEGDYVQFQGKTYQINPVKVRVLAFTKEWSRAEELPEPSELQGEQAVEKETVQSRFGKLRYLRVGIVHGNISKSIQALKLNVQ